MKNPQFPIARKTGIVIQEVPEEVLVYDLDTNKAHCLNQTAALVWKACDGNRSIPDIAKYVESLAGGNISDDFVWLAIDQLSENNLLEQEMNAKFQRNYSKRRDQENRTLHDDRRSDHRVACRTTKRIGKRILHL